MLEIELGPVQLIVIALIGLSTVSVVLGIVVTLLSPVIGPMFERRAAMRHPYRGSTPPTRG
jgi:hypothetical protein